MAVIHVRFLIKIIQLSSHIFSFSLMCFQMDSYYIVLCLAPMMSESGTQKHSREAYIINNFQDFLQELEGQCCLYV